MTNEQQYSGIPTPPLEENQPPIQQMETPPQNKSKSPLITVIALIALCLIGGGVFAYYKFLTPTISSPTEILKNGLRTSFNVRSLSFVATSTVQVENQPNDVIFPFSSLNFNFTSNGSVDFHSLVAPLFDVTVGINMAVNSATSGGGLLSLEANTIHINKNFYFNLKNFNALYTLPPGATEMQLPPGATEMQMAIFFTNGFALSLKNKWVQIGTSEADKTSSFQNSLKHEDMAVIRNYILGMSYVTAINNIGSESINGVSTHHLKVTIQNRQELLNLIRKIILEKREVDMVVFNKGMDDLSKVVSQKIDLDIWIGKSDSLVYKVVLSPIIISGSQVEGKTTISQEVVFSNHNQPVSVSAPQGTVSLEQVLQLFNIYNKR